MPFINASAIRRGRKVAALVAAFAAAPLVCSAVAHSDPDPIVPAADPRAQCESAEFGGVFITTSAAQDPVSHSVCQYIVEGYFYYDNYENGAYTGTLVYRDGAKVPTERPPIPELLTVPRALPLVPFPGQF